MTFERERLSPSIFSNAFVYLIRLRRKAYVQNTIYHVLLEQFLFLERVSFLLLESRFDIEEELLLNCRLCKEEIDKLNSPFLLFFLIEFEKSVHLIWALCLLKSSLNLFSGIPRAPSTGPSGAAPVDSGANFTNELRREFNY